MFPSAQHFQQILQHLMATTLVKAYYLYISRKDVNKRHQLFMDQGKSVDIKQLIKILGGADAILQYYLSSQNQSPLTTKRLHQINNLFSSDTSISSISAHGLDKDIVSLCVKYIGNKKCVILCTNCNKILTIKQFSKSQISKATPRCKQCITKSFNAPKKKKKQAKTAKKPFEISKLKMH